jgi:hypothetical protein
MNASIRIQLNMTNGLFVKAAIVQFYFILAFPEYQLRLVHQQVYHGLPTTIIYDYHDNKVIPIGILKIYEDLSNPQYMIMYILYSSTIDITVSPRNCPHSSSLITEGKILGQSN